MIPNTPPPSEWGIFFKQQQSGALRSIPEGLLPCWEGLCVGEMLYNLKSFFKRPFKISQYVPPVSQQLSPGHLNDVLELGGCTKWQVRALCNLACSSGTLPPLRRGALP